VTGQAPDRPDQSSIAIVPCLKAFRAGINSFSFQFSHDLAPDAVGLVRFGAWPWQAERIVKALSPILVGLVMALGSVILAPCIIRILKRRPDLNWIGGKIRHSDNWML
jgi:hypothetical protein